MIDLHAHILPGADDGAADLQTALAMAKAGAEQGLKVVAATPHFHQIPDWKLIKKKVAQLQSDFDREKIGLTVIAGAELLLDADIVELADECIPTYGDQGKYCLIEFPFRQIPIFADRVLFFLQIKNLIPIIAHPERYLPVVENPNIVGEWIKRGYLIQINTGSILGSFGSDIRNTAKIMLTHDMVHMIASDAHDHRHRSLNLAQGYEAAEEILGAENAWELVHTNPAFIMEGRQLHPVEPREYRKRKRFLFF